jgi:hypothetical protein
VKQQVGQLPSPSVSTVTVQYRVFEPDVASTFQVRVLKVVLMFPAIENVIEVALDPLEMFTLPPAPLTAVYVHVAL